MLLAWTAGEEDHHGFFLVNAREPEQTCILSEIVVLITGARKLIVGVKNGDRAGFHFGSKTLAVGFEKLGGEWCIFHIDVEVCAFFKFMGQRTDTFAYTDKPFPDKTNLFVYELFFGQIFSLPIF
jgi:hypothetical protein